MPIDRAMPADEEAMLEDGADGTFDRIGFAEAALIAFFDAHLKAGG
jgi:hypothetical protein